MRLSLLLFALFLTLKLTGTVAWSWFWVLSPLWGFLAFLVALFLLFSAMGAGIIGSFFGTFHTIAESFVDDPEKETEAESSSRRSFFDRYEKDRKAKQELLNRILDK